MPHFLALLTSLFWFLNGPPAPIPVRPAAPPVAPANQHQLMPVPTEVRWGAGRYLAKAGLGVQLETTTDPAVAAAASRLTSRLARQTKGDQAKTGLTIRYGRPGQVRLGEDESYNLRVTPMGMSLQAATSLGVLRGLATVEQLLTSDKKGFYFPEVDITDKPRFAWRGLLIDAARHFMPLPVIKRNLDGMAAVKMNVLHWHLSDDQGFRVESRVLPRLHEVGSGGQYYTQDQVREVLAYAAARGIRVVPELDVPGHATSWLAAYPELAANDSTYGIPLRWGVLNIAMDPTKETTYALLDKLFGEMTALFPDPYFHIGGDENDGRQWRRSPRIMAFAKEKGYLKANGQLDKHALQTYFNRRILTLVTARGKKMIGWDEILGPGLPEDAVIQSWRGRKGLIEAVKAGHSALLSNGYYLDLNYGAASHYLNDPMPTDAGLTAAEQQRILGGEAAMWAEFADSVILDSRIWPRAAAVAERFWSPASVRNVPDMYRRLALVSDKLELLGLQHRRAPEQILTQLAGGKDVAPLQTLASVLEPVKEYKRHFQGFKYTTQTPLNRLVDAAPAESEVARQFAVKVDSLLKSLNSTTAGTTLTPGTRVQITSLSATLRQWQANDQRLQPLLLAGSSLWEYAPLSVQLRTIAALGLERLTMLQKGQAPTAAWQAAAIRQLDLAKAPAGQTELAVVGSIRKLVERK
ncbi:beta-N-acetylhexosaminidase [Hymenobacter sp. BT175]|uniref:beta-N-acetylhexosaminidase n=1 Tax=Hymenobacter translucens TaxID=2886507 RepID=UPI001D0E5247|nr:family 20 glycosylhydrolase [Hymenobacter translucens]MCC2547066.1 beta-N-acetylhexosaminidase [Hymenobacter translucens]